MRLPARCAGGRPDRLGSVDGRPGRFGARAPTMLHPGSGAGHGVRHAAPAHPPAARAVTLRIDALVEVLIRPFRPIDLDGLFVLDYRCYAAPYRFGYQQLLLTLQQSDVTTLVIQGEQEGDVVGGLIVRGNAGLRQLAIVSLMIAPEFRRMGLGSRLLDWAVEYARRSRWLAVTVPVETRNEGAMAFLGAKGFEDSGVGQPYFPAPEIGTLWRMATGAPAESAP